MSGLLRTFYIDTMITSKAPATVAAERVLWVSSRRVRSTKQGKIRWMHVETKTDDLVCKQAKTLLVIREII